MYYPDEGTGYMLISDQGVNKFHIFSREGTAQNPFAHALVKVITVNARQSGSSETMALPLNAQPSYGLFIAVSANKTFELYRWEDIAGTELKKIGGK